MRGLGIAIGHCLLGHRHRYTNSDTKADHACIGFNLDFVVESLPMLITACSSNSRRRVVCVQIAPSCLLDAVTLRAFSPIFQHARCALFVRVVGVVPWLMARVESLQLIATQPCEAHTCHQECNQLKLSILSTVVDQKAVKLLLQVDQLPHAAMPGFKECKAGLSVVNLRLTLARNCLSV